MAISSQSSSYLRQHHCPLPSPITYPVLPIELERQILSWLPVKSLMRFKSVCQIWRSIILDPDFARVHQRGRGAFKGLLISESFGFEFVSTTNFYYMTPEPPTNQILYQATVTADSFRIGAHMYSTKQVNGLVCFYNCNRALLYNVATRESMQLPDSVDRSETCTYNLGFDPVNKLYKLVKICQFYDPWAEEEFPLFLRNSCCEVLTFGEGVKDAPLSWRNISPPPWKLLSESLCYNGVLYWMEMVAPTEEWGVDPESIQHLFAFDLSEERFYIFFPATNYYGYYLVPFGPGVCLYSRIPSAQLSQDWYELVMLCYCHGNGGGGRELLSTESRLNISMSTLHPIGILPNGKLFLYNNDDIENTFLCQNPESVPVRRCYLYDLSNGALENIVVPPVIYPSTTRVISAWPRLDISSASYYEENILSLKALLAS